jgi:hypothetical protein
LVAVHPGMVADYIAAINCTIRNGVAENPQMAIWL